MRFIIEPSDIVTTAGKTIRLDCEAKFDSVATLPQIRWRFPDGQYFDFIGDTRRYLSNFIRTKLFVLCISVYFFICYENLVFNSIIF